MLTLKYHAQNAAQHIDSTHVQLITDKRSSLCNIHSLAMHSLQSLTAVRLISLIIISMRYIKIKILLNYFVLCLVVFSLEINNNRKSYVRMV
jgi:hypothetical protein